MTGLVIFVIKIARSFFFCQLYTSTIFTSGRNMESLKKMSGVILEMHMKEKKLAPRHGFSVLINFQKNYFSDICLKKKFPSCYFFFFVYLIFSSLLFSFYVLVLKSVCKICVGTIWASLISCRAILLCLTDFKCK